MGLPFRSADPQREPGAWGSHYGISRTFRVFFDLITIRFLLRYLSRPLHFFGDGGDDQYTCWLLGGGMVGLRRYFTTPICWGSMARS